jgi:hypothetical protein
MEPAKTGETGSERKPSKVIEMGRVSEETRGLGGPDFEGPIPNDFPV